MSRIPTRQELEDISKSSCQELDTRLSILGANVAKTQEQVMLSHDRLCKFSGVEDRLIKVEEHHTSMQRQLAVTVSLDQLSTSLGKMQEQVKVNCIQELVKDADCNLRQGARPLKDP